jgi:hypothetical protein
VSSASITNPDGNEETITPIELSMKKVPGCDFASLSSP